MKSNRELAEDAERICIGEKDESVIKLWQSIFDELRPPEEPVMTEAERQILDSLVKGEAAVIRLPECEGDINRPGWVWAHSVAGTRCLQGIWVTVPAMIDRGWLDVIAKASNIATGFTHYAYVTEKGKEAVG